MTRTSKAILLLSSLTLLLSTSAMAADPTIDQVHSVAAAGNIDQARSMMDQVLKDHPNSAKAHYVEAELMARQHDFADAKSQLAKAEDLAPGLPFVSKHSIGELRAQLSGGNAAPRMINQAPHSSGFSIWPVLLIGLLIFGALALFRRRQSQVAYQDQYPAPMGGGYGAPGYGAPGYGAQPGAWGPQPTGGMGSGIMGGLATGAAMGAGFAAGEAIVDHFTHGDRDRERYEGGGGYSSNDYDRNPNQDMGGNDFGISDSGSWDDNSGGGGDDGGW